MNIMDSEPTLIYYTVMPYYMLDENSDFPLNFYVVDIDNEGNVSNHFFHFVLNYDYRMMLEAVVNCILVDTCPVILTWLLMDSVAGTLQTVILVLLNDATLERKCIKITYLKIRLINLRTTGSCIVIIWCLSFS